MPAAGIVTKVQFEAWQNEYYKRETSPEARKSIRNEMVNSVIAAIDIEYYQFEKSKNHNTRIKETGIAVASFGLTSTSTFLGGAAVQAGRVMTAVAAGLTGANSLVDEKFFKSQTELVLAAQMNKQRADKRVNLKDFQVKKVDEYPWAAAVADLVDYYHCGTYERALHNLLGKVTVDANASKQDADNSRPGKPETTAREKAASLAQ